MGRGKKCHHPHTPPSPGPPWRHISSGGSWGRLLRGHGGTHWDGGGTGRCHVRPRLPPLLLCLPSLGRSLQGALQPLQLFRQPGRGRGQREWAGPRGTQSIPRWGGNNPPVPVAQVDLPPSKLRPQTLPRPLLLLLHQSPAGPRRLGEAGRRSQGDSGAGRGWSQASKGAEPGIQALTWPHRLRVPAAPLPPAGGALWGGGGACHHPQGSQASTGGGARRLGGGARPPWGRSQASVGAEPQAPRGLTLAQQPLPCLLQLHQFSLQLGGGLQERGHRGGEEGTPQGWGRGDAEVGGTGHPRGPGLTCASRRCLCSSVMSSSCCQNSCLQGRVRQVSCDTHVT